MSYSMYDLNGYKVVELKPYEVRTEVEIKIPFWLRLLTWNWRKKYKKEVTYGRLLAPDQVMIDEVRKVIYCGSEVYCKLMKAMQK